MSKISNETREKLISWMLSRDTGVSSKTIAAVALGVDYMDAFVPCDASDFGRCYRLLEIAPELREVLPEVSRKYPSWEPIVSQWEQLSALYERDRASGHSAELSARISVMRRPDYRGTDYDLVTFLDLAKTDQAAAKVYLQEAIQPGGKWKAIDFISRIDDFYHQDAFIRETAGQLISENKGILSLTSSQSKSMKPFVQMYKEFAQAERIQQKELDSTMQKRPRMKA